MYPADSSALGIKTSVQGFGDSELLSFSSLKVSGTPHPLDSFYLWMFEPSGSLASADGISLQELAALFPLHVPAGVSPLPGRLPEALLNAFS